MAQYVQINSDNPQPRLVNQAIACLRSGGVIVYPTDSGYALGCCIGDKAALERIRRIRRLDDKHNFTLICRDLSELAAYARFDNWAYRLLRSYTPGAYTFILKATHEVPRRLQHPKKKTIGVRVPDNIIALGLLEAMGEPLMTTSLHLPDEDEDMLIDPMEIKQLLGRQVDFIIDGGFCGNRQTSIIDLTDSHPLVLRVGAGDVTDFQ